MFEDFYGVRFIPHITNDKANGLVVICQLKIDV